MSSAGEAGQDSGASERGLMVDWALVAVGVTTRAICSRHHATGTSSFGICLLRPLLAACLTAETPSASTRPSPAHTYIRLTGTRLPSRLASDPSSITRGQTERGKLTHSILARSQILAVTLASQVEPVLVDLRTQTRGRWELRAKSDNGDTADEEEQDTAAKGKAK
jgi:hypothetical protein